MHLRILQIAILVEERDKDVLEVAKKCELGAMMMMKPMTVLLMLLALQRRCKPS
jgi:hypothetical protein